MTCREPPAEAPAPAKLDRLHKRGVTVPLAALRRPLKGTRGESGCCCCLEGTAAAAAAAMYPGAHAAAAANACGDGGCGDGGCGEGCCAGCMQLMLASASAPAGWASDGRCQPLRDTVLLQRTVRLGRPLGPSWLLRCSATSTCCWAPSGCWSVPAAAADPASAAGQAGSGRLMAWGSAAPLATLLPRTAAEAALEKRLGCCCGNCCSSCWDRHAWRLPVAAAAAPLVGVAGRELAAEGRNQLLAPDRGGCPGCCWFQRGELGCDRTASSVEEPSSMKPLLLSTSADGEGQEGAVMQREISCFG